MKNKRVLIAILIGVLLISIVGVTFAAYTYTRSGTSNSKQVVGDIYMHYTESNTLTLENAMPSSSYIANKYFEFTIDGKNTTTNKDIIYDISLVHGDVPTGKTESNRIADQFLKFRLVEVVNSTETELIASNSYSDLTNKRIYAATVPKNTTSQVTHTYRLYMWISDEVGIGINTDYTMTEWENLFASVKVNVTGDFNEKEYAKPFNQIIQTANDDSEIMFYEVNGTDNGNGLYMMKSTESDTYPIYYYRGNVDNNNLYFAETCWKIVRTTSTGGLKLIYNGEADNVNGEKQCNQTTVTGTQLPSSSSFNSTNSPAYVGYSLPESDKLYTYSTNLIESGFWFGSSVNPTTHELVDPQTSLDKYHHYSYNSTDEHATGVSNETGKVRYYYYHEQEDDSYYGSYLQFDKTKSISTILNEMLAESNSKNNPSSIQNAINSWWGTGGNNSLNSKYGSYLEDTEWCNDRSIYTSGGFNPNGGGLEFAHYYTTDQSIFFDLIFNVRARYDLPNYRNNNTNIAYTNTPILTCSNPNDRLTVVNGNLTYPIGLLTYDEVAMAGGRWSIRYSYESSTLHDDYYLYTGRDYWLMSPSDYEDGAAVGYIDYRGNMTCYPVYSYYGVRPVLSLKRGTEIIKGDGTATNPYIVTED